MKAWLKRIVAAFVRKPTHKNWKLLQLNLAEKNKRKK